MKEIKDVQEKVIASCFVVVLALLIYIPNSFGENLKIYQIDVEQGDATLIVSPSRNTLLIDSGKNGHGSRIKSAMDQAGVTKIDHFVNTHYHEDHYGGIDELVNMGVPVVRSYDRGDKDYIPQKKKNGVRYREYDQAVGSRAIKLTRDDSIILDPELTITCIAAGGVVRGEESSVHGEDENDMSIALLVSYGDFNYFTGGDIENTTEGKIADRDLVLDVDLYKANHHASNTSSSLAFMEDLNPSVILISNGNNGTYQHPRNYTLNTFASLSSHPAIFQTNKYLKGGLGGNVFDEDFIADPETIDEDGTILIVVDKEAGNYTVSLPGNSYHYQIKSRSTLASSVVIESLLPDPVGSDMRFEEVTIRNSGSFTVPLNGWVLRDKSNKIWPLAFLREIKAGQSLRVMRHGMPMSLNNDGDKIYLLDPNNSVKDSFVYQESHEGKVLNTNH